MGRITQIEDWATFWLCCITSSPCPPGCPTKCWWYGYCTWLLTNELYWQYILCKENIGKTSWLPFLCCNQGWRHRLLHSIVRNPSVMLFLAVQLLDSYAQKESFTCRSNIKIYGQLCEISILVQFGIIFCWFKKYPCKTYSHSSLDTRITVWRTLVENVWLATFLWINIYVTKLYTCDAFCRCKTRLE